MPRLPNKHHLEFIRLVSQNVNQDEAYMVTIGNNRVTKSTARVKGSQLAKRYALEISEAKKNAQDIITRVNESELVKTALNGILTQAEVDKKLCDIITKGKLESDRLRAIDIYNKRFGSNQAAKMDLRLLKGGLDSEDVFV